MAIVGSDSTIGSGSTAARPDTHLLLRHAGKSATHERRRGSEHTRSPSQFGRAPSATGAPLPPRPTGIARRDAPAPARRSGPTSRRSVGPATRRPNARFGLARPSPENAAAPASLRGSPPLPL